MKLKNNYPMIDYVKIKLTLAGLYTDEYYGLTYRQLLVDLILLNNPTKFNHLQLVDAQALTTAS